VFSNRLTEVSLWRIIQVLLLYCINYVTITGPCTLHTMLTIFSSNNTVVNLNDFSSISATKQLNWMAIWNDYGHTWWWQTYITPILRAPLLYIIMLKERLNGQHNSRMACQAWCFVFINVHRLL